MVAVRAVVVGTVVVHCALCVLQAQAQAEEDSAGQLVTQEIAQVGRALGKAAMVIPLLIGISARLAVLVPSFFIGLFGIFLFVAISKKALIISLLALLISYLDKHKNSRPKIVHVHHEGHHDGHHFPELGAIEFETTPHHHTPHHKLFDFPYKKPLRKWPKTDNGPWMFTGPMEMNMDSYLPQHSSYLPNQNRRMGQNLRPPFIYAPQGVYYPSFMWNNSTEPPPNANTTVGLTPQLQKFIDKAMVEDEDPR